MNAAQEHIKGEFIEFIYFFADSDIKSYGKISQSTIDLFKLNEIVIPLRYMSYL